MGPAAGAAGGASVHSARAAVYAGLAGVAIGPLGAIGRAARREEPSEPVFDRHDKIFLKHALVDVEDPDIDGSRKIHLICCWEDATGGSEDEIRHGFVQDVHDKRTIVWTGSEVLPPDPSRWRMFEGGELRR